MIYRASGILLLYCYLLKSVVCIPLDQFYPFGPGATEPSSLLGDGNDVSSRRIFTQQVFQFFGQPHDSIIVSYSLFSVPYAYDSNTIVHYKYVIYNCTSIT